MKHAHPRIQTRTKLIEASSSDTPARLAGPSADNSACGHRDTAGCNTPLARERSPKRADPERRPDAKTPPSAVPSAAALHGRELRTSICSLLVGGTRSGSAGVRLSAYYGQPGAIHAHGIVSQHAHPSECRKLSSASCFWAEGGRLWLARSNRLGSVEGVVEQRSLLVRRSLFIARHNYDATT